MSKIDNPLFKKIGAFWIEGNNEPFYGLNDAKEYQRNKGGNILNYHGKVIINDPGPAVVEEVTAPKAPPPPPATAKKKNLWNLFGLLG